MKLIFYPANRTTPVEIGNLDSVKLVINDGEPVERHVHVNTEGIVVDLIEEGAVLGTTSRTHEELLPSPEEDDDEPTG